MIEILLLLSGVLALGAARSESSRSSNLALTEHFEAPGPGREPVRWTTGVSVHFQFARNTETSPYMGDKFAQNVEPAGRYLTTLGIEPKYLPPDWEHGEIQFHNPLVLALIWPLERPDGTESSYRGPEGWKHRLSKAFDGKTGAALTRALLEAGYDGIVTVTMPTPGSRQGAYISEIVDITVLRGTKGNIKTLGRPRRISRERVAELAGQGFTQTQIAEELGINPSSVHRIVKELGLSLRRGSSGRPRHISRERVAELAGHGFNQRQIAKKLGISRISAHLIIKELGLSPGKGVGAGTPRRISRERVAELAGQGFTQRQIAEELGINQASVSRIMKELRL